MRRAALGLLFRRPRASTTLRCGLATGRGPVDRGPEDDRDPLDERGVARRRDDARDELQDENHEEEVDEYRGEEYTSPLSTLGEVDLSGPQNDEQIIRDNMSILEEPVKRRRAEEWDRLEWEEKAAVEFFPPWDYKAVGEAMDRQDLVDGGLVELGVQPKFSTDDRRWLYHEMGKSLVDSENVEDEERRLIDKKARGEKLTLEEKAAFAPRVVRDAIISTPTEITEQMLQAKRARVARIKAHRHETVYSEKRQEDYGDYEPDLRAKLLLKERLQRNRPHVKIAEEGEQTSLLDPDVLKIGDVELERDGFVAGVEPEELRESKGLSLEDYIEQSKDMYHLGKLIDLESRRDRAEFPVNPLALKDVIQPDAQTREEARDSSLPPLIPGSPDDEVAEDIEMGHETLLPPEMLDPDAQLDEDNEPDDVSTKPKCTICFCKGHAPGPLDPLNMHLLLLFMDANGDIKPRRVTGLCKKMQKKVAVTVKRAKHLHIFEYKECRFGATDPFVLQPRFEDYINEIAKRAWRRWYPGEPVPLPYPKQKLERFTKESFHQEKQ